MVKRSSTNLAVMKEMIEDSDLTFLISMTGHWLTQETKKGLTKEFEKIILITSDLNTQVEMHKSIFKDVVYLDRGSLENSSYVSSRLFINFSIALHYQLFSILQ